MIIIIIKYRVEAFDWAIPGDTISITGSSIVVSVADLNPEVEYIYKCSARNAIGSSTFAQKSLKQLKTEFCPAIGLAAKGGLGYLWIVIVILVIVLLALLVMILVLCLRKKKQREDTLRRAKGSSVRKPLYIPHDSDDDQPTLIPSTLESAIATEKTDLTPKRPPRRSDSSRNSNSRANSNNHPKIIRNASAKSNRTESSLHDYTPNQTVHV